MRGMLSAVVVAACSLVCSVALAVPGQAADEQPPTVRRLTLSATSVNVTNQRQLVGMSVRVTDDTGIDFVQLFASDGAGHALHVADPNLVRGTVRDGVWRTPMIVPRWSDPGLIDISVLARDRVGRVTNRTYPNVLRVIDRNPDTEMPSVRLLQPTGDAVFNVRSSARRVTIKARITDAASGVANGGRFCLYRPIEGGYTNLPCGLVDLVSGNRYDGIWRSHVTIPQGSSGGDWNVGIQVTDRAHSGDTAFWMGPDLYRQQTGDGTYEDPNFHRFPQGRGRICVIGTTDSTPPQVISAEVTPTQVDTGQGNATVHIRVHALDDPGEGVTGVLAELRPGTSHVGDIAVLCPTDLQLAGGTEVDGIWEGDITLPQGVPPGTYYLSVDVEDRTHRRHYAAASSPAADQPDTIILSSDPKVTDTSNQAS